MLTDISLGFNCKQPENFEKKNRCRRCTWYVALHWCKRNIYNSFGYDKQFYNSQINYQEKYIIIICISKYVYRIYICMDLKFPHFYMHI